MRKRTDGHILMRKSFVPATGSNLWTIRPRPMQSPDASSTPSEQPATTDEPQTDGGSETSNERR